MLRVFRFDNLLRSEDGSTISCSCTISPDMPFFQGHFPGRPIMPAVTQLDMIQSLLQQNAGWNGVLTGGDALKFSGQVRPGDSLAIHIVRRPDGDITFSIKNENTLVSKGILRLAGEAID